MGVVALATAALCLAWVHEGRWADVLDTLAGAAAAVAEDLRGET